MDKTTAVARLAAVLRLHRHVWYDVYVRRMTDLMGPGEVPVNARCGTCGNVREGLACETVAAAIGLSYPATDPAELDRHTRRRTGDTGTLCDHPRLVPRQPCVRCANEKENRS